MKWYDRERKNWWGMSEMTKLKEKDEDEWMRNDKIEKSNDERVK